MIFLDEIQASIISHLKATVSGSAYKLDNDEIRERQWQGTQFVYPNVRIDVGQCVPERSNCVKLEINFDVLVFSEEASSYQASRIAGIISDALHDKSYTSEGLRLSTWVSSLNPTVRTDESTWQASLSVRGSATRT